MSPGRPDSVATLVALATARGPGAVCILRLSGPRALEIVRSLCPALPAHPEPRRLTLRRVIDPATGTTLDRALVVFFAGPSSFTGEDVVEIQAHGGEAMAEELLAVTLSAGARLARPGEFSRRAFENGRLDLAQAEGLAALVDASSRAGLRAARGLFGGELSARVEELLDGITSLLSPLEASLDFSDDLEEGEGVEQAQGETLARLHAELSALHRSYSRGRLLRQGARVVLVGAPNVGKSSLFNALCGHRRAIVHGSPGTTRDLVEGRVELSGVEITLVDTAGLRGGSGLEIREDENVGEAVGEVEAEGQARTQEAARSADLLLVIEDLASSEAARPARFAREGAWGPVPTLRVGNKMDLLKAGAERPERVVVSARTGEGIEALELALLEALGLGPTARGPREGEPSGGLEIELTLARHAAAVEAAAEALGQARDIQEARGGLDALIEELREARRQLSGIVGRVALPEEILDGIFARFCLGK